MNGDVPFADLPCVFLLETGVPSAKRPRKDCPLLGVHRGRAVYLLYNGVLGDKRPAGGNVLTGAVLAAFRRIRRALDRVSSMARPAVWARPRSTGKASSSVTSPTPCGRPDQTRENAVGCGYGRSHTTSLILVNLRSTWMPDYRRWYEPGGTYFFTAVAHMRQPIFCGDIARLRVFTKPLRRSDKNGHSNWLRSCSCQTTSTRYGRFPQAMPAIPPGGSGSKRSLRARTCDAAARKSRQASRVCCKESEAFGNNGTGNTPCATWKT